MDIIIAVSSGVLAVLTGIYVVLTYRILRAQTDPCVIVYVQANPVNPLLLEIAIENVGKGLAKDVRFEFSEPIPNCLPGPNCTNTPMSFGPLINGIAALPPGGKRAEMWGSYMNIERIVGDKTYRVICRFRRAGQDLLDLDGPEQTECIVEYKSFYGSHTLTVEHDTLETLREVAKHLRPAPGAQGYSSLRGH
jgi:hypothetical protein